MRERGWRIVCRTARDRDGGSAEVEFEESVSHLGAVRAKACRAANCIAGTSPSTHAQRVTAPPAMNLLTTCVLSGALATSFFARPVAPEPTVDSAPTATPIAQESDEAQTPKRFENPSWSRVLRVAFVPGKEGAAVDLIQNHFRPATEASGGSQPKAFQHATGRYNLTVIWHLPEGTDSLNWELSPSNAAFRAALAEQLGGADKARKMLETYRSYVREYEIDLVRTLEFDSTRPAEASSTK